ncbi:transglutaminase N-terminal domain-containing protein [Methyloraptor flagellatus]|jgi:transglutaminase-like putative cysteine protease|uniref:Transglutaminase family protein n=1 Tax=Methyloraptor flagellatus TaxID=3162530 RepID=A0AAU7X993_9HYPH
MRYRITHVTTYDYFATVPFADCRLRLTPASRDGQTLVSTEISVEPRPEHTAIEVDWFGNRVTRVSFRVPHRRLTIRQTALVDIVPRALPVAQTTPPFEVVRDAVPLGRALSPDAPVHYVFPSRFVPLAEPIESYARKSFPAGRPILAGAIELARRIKADFVYDPTATDVATPLAAAFATRRGVCQDFAQVMISGLRSLGIGAAYVSGYLRTEPPPGRPRLEGADATHAWVDVWCGETLGWIGIDPTNGILVGTDHIAIGRGRDYADVAPVTGVVTSAGGQGLSVGVDVVEVPVITEATARTGGSERPTQADAAVRW